MALEIGINRRMSTQITTEARELARKIADSEKADLYIYSGPVNERGYAALIRACKRFQPNALLLLTTNGGSANAAYRIARWLQGFYETFGVVVCSYCKSAGTLVTTGAHRLLMSPVSGELGPLDVQLNKRDELWEQRSGLTLRNALTSLADRAEHLFTQLMVSIKAGSAGSVRFKLAAELAGEMTKGLFAPIYEQITPEGLGEDYQDLMVAVEYGNRLAKVGSNIGEDAIDKLVHQYPSHDFVIDLTEARTLFAIVEDITSDLLSLALKLHPLAFVPESEKVTVEHLSKPDESQEKKDEGDTDAAAKTNDGGGSSDASAA